MHDDEREGAQREQPLPWLGVRVRVSVSVRGRGRGRGRANLGRRSGVGSRHASVGWPEQ